MFKKKIVKPELTTLKKYKINFTTVDGINHTYTKVPYADGDSVLCSIGEYYMIDEKFLKDDEGLLYPINNIVKIEFVETETIENVVKKYYGSICSYTWYQKKDIEIYIDNSN